MAELTETEILELKLLCQERQRELKHFKAATVRDTEVELARSEYEAAVKLANDKHKEVMNHV